MKTYQITCSECRETIGHTEDIRESYQGGFCGKCREELNRVIRRIGFIGGRTMAIYPQKGESFDSWAKRLAVASEAARETEEGMPYDAALRTAYAQPLFRQTYDRLVYNEEYEEMEGVTP